MKRKHRKSFETKLDRRYFSLNRWCVCLFISFNRLKMSEEHRKWFHLFILFSGDVINDQEYSLEPQGNQNDSLIYSIIDRFFIDFLLNKWYLCGKIEMKSVQRTKRIEYLFHCFLLVIENDWASVKKRFLLLSLFCSHRHRKKEKRREKREEKGMLRRWMCVNVFDWWKELNLCLCCQRSSEQFRGILHFHLLSYSMKINGHRKSKIFLFHSFRFEDIYPNENYSKTMLRNVFLRQGDRTRWNLCFHQWINIDQGICSTFPFVFLYFGWRD